MNRYKVGLAQIHSLLGNVEDNLNKHLEYIDRAKAHEVDVLAFPELSLTGYLLRDLAYEVSDKCLEALDEVKKASKGICVIVGLVEETRLGIYRNSLAIVQNGALKGFIPKVYLPNYGLFEESRYFTRGYARDLKLFNHKGLKFSAVICEDAWHPEPIEFLSRIGADLVFICSSSPLRGLYGKDDTFVEKLWESMNITRAVENTVFIAYVNRVGVEDEEYFWGGSMVISPTGEILVRAKKMEENLLIAEIDLHTLRRARRFSSFKDHAIDLHRYLSELP